MDSPSYCPLPIILLPPSILLQILPGDPESMRRIPNIALSAWGRRLSSCVIASHLFWTVGIHLSLLRMDLPMPITFFQFQSPIWSLRVSCHDPGPISFVLVAIGSISDQPRSGASPSVRATHFVRLKEKEVWHFSICAGRWNFGTRNTNDVCSS
jgi:hypothetical protein